MEETENRDTENREQHPHDNQSRGDASPDGGASDGRPRGRRRRRSRRGRGRGGAPGAIQVAGSPAEGGESQGPAIREIPVTREAAQELVDCLWLKFEEKTAYGATIGGRLADGSDASNELSLMCVRSEQTKLNGLSARCRFTRWIRSIAFLSATLQPSP